MDHSKAREVPEAQRKAKSLGGFGFLLFSLSLVAAPLAHAQFDSKRQQERKSTRWTLSDWLDTKKRISEQNTWLSNHVNKVPIDGALAAEQSPEKLRGSFDFYMMWLGARFAYEHPITYLPSGQHHDIGGPRTQIDLQLRLFGNNIQDTNIVLRGGAGYDQVEGMGAYDGNYLGWGLEPEVQIYFAKFLGVWGSWRYRFAGKPVDQRGVELSGTSWKSAAFLEVNALRLEAGYQSRKWNFKRSDGSDESLVINQSLFLGARLFY
ncbi:MAG TPA: hypothetical protein VM901_09435 [Bdellovibrionota bacterium]|nr:hypothetical protein [Bdellovibrionota bacterium]